MPFRGFALDEVDDHIMNWAKSLGGIMRSCPLPDNLVPEVLRAEDAIHQNAEIAARQRFAVRLNRACWLEDSVQLH